MVDDQWILEDVMISY